MSRTAVLLVIAFLVFSIAALADGQSEQITIWHQFYFDKGLDYNQFNELASTRSQFRRTFVEEIAALMELGAKPIDAAVVLLALDNHYLETLDRAERGIEASFAAEFRSALVAQYERVNKPQRLIVTDGAYFANQTPNAQARRAPANVDVVASGTWSNIDGNTVRVSVDFVSIGTGHLTSFTAQGTVPMVAEDIAFQLFDYFEKNRFPQPENALSNLEIRPALPGHQSRMGVPYDVAVRTCESQGFRLPYSYEMDVIFALGAYQQGGIHIDPNWYYHVADNADHIWLAPGKLEHVHGTSLANFDKRDYYYVMVKGPPSQKIQIVTALNSFLQNEYRKKEPSRNSLVLYAVRLVLGDLNAKHSENDVSQRVMAQEFSNRGIEPWDYLKGLGLPRAIGLTPTMQAELDRMLDRPGM